MIFRKPLSYIRDVFQQQKKHVCFFCRLEDNQTVDGNNLLGNCLQHPELYNKSRLLFYYEV